MYNVTNQKEEFKVDFDLLGEGGKLLRDYTDLTPSKYKNTYKKEKDKFVWYKTEIVQ